jgi:hypothetical protein
MRSDASILDDLRVVCESPRSAVWMLTAAAWVSRRPRTARGGGNGYNARPTGSSPGLVSGRAGLVGLDERVRLAGGTLSHGPSADGGFMVVARMPVTKTSVPVRGATPSISQRELEHARRRLRRGLRQAVVAAVAAGAVLAFLMFGLWIYTETHSVLGDAAYQAMRLGDSATEVQSGLPPVRYEVGPNDEKKPGCAYYRIKQFAPTPAYELCFADDRLASKAIVN